MLSSVLEQSMSKRQLFWVILKGDRKKRTGTGVLLALAYVLPDPGPFPWQECCRQSSGFGGHLQYTSSPRDEKNRNRK